MTEKTEMYEMDTIYLNMKNTVYECKKLLEGNKNGGALSSIERDMLDIDFDCIKRLIELSQKCWNEIKKQKEMK